EEGGASNSKRWAPTQERHRPSRRSSPRRAPARGRVTSSVSPTTARRTHLARRTAKPHPIVRAAPSRDQATRADACLERAVRCPSQGGWAAPPVRCVTSKASSATSLHDDCASFAASAKPGISRPSPGLLTTLRAIGLAAARGHNQRRLRTREERCKAQLADGAKPLRWGVCLINGQRGRRAAAGAQLRDGVRRQLKRSSSLTRAYRTARSIRRRADAQAQ